MKRFGVTKVVGVAFLGAMMALGSACTKKEGTTSSAGTTAAPSSDTIKIGEVGSMTGSEATFGVSTHNAILLAVDQINAAGGVKGRKLEIVSLDDQSKPQEAAQAIQKLISQDKVTAVLGEVASSRSLAMAPIAQQNKIPMISTASTNPAVTAVGDYIFRVCFIDPFQGSVMAKFASENLKAKRVAILRDVKNDYSVGLANFFTEKFKSLGGEIVTDVSYSSGDRDFKSQLTNIRGKNPEAIFVPGYYTEVGMISKQARDLGITVPLLGGDGWDSPKLTEIGGKAIDGSYFSNHYSQQDQNPRVQEFITKYKAKYGSVPDALAALGYDAALILADAMGRAPTLDSDAIRKAISETKNFDAVTGKIALNEKRDAVKSAVVLKVTGNDFVYQATVNP